MRQQQRWQSKASLRSTRPCLWTHKGGAKKRQDSYQHPPKIIPSPKSQEKTFSSWTTRRYKMRKWHLVSNEGVVLAGCVVAEDRHPMTHALPPQGNATTPHSSLALDNRGAPLAAENVSRKGNSQSHYDQDSQTSTGSLKCRQPPPLCHPPSCTGSQAPPGGRYGYG